MGADSDVTDGAAETGAQQVMESKMSGAEENSRNRQSRRPRVPLLRKGLGGSCCGMCRHRALLAMTTPKARATLIYDLVDPNDDTDKDLNDSQNMPVLDVNRSAD